MFSVLMPPSDYSYPSTDLLGGLDEISSRAAAGGYSSQYQFDLALNDLVNSAHEGHLFLHTCTTASILYQRGYPERLQLVSVSEDGLQLPQVYIYGKKLLS